MQLHAASHTLRFGAPLAQAAGAVILIHGRGSSADDLVGLVDALGADALAYLIPSATGGTWYPQRFFVSPAQNEPWLSRALTVVNQFVEEAHAAGLPYERIGLAGFSQGACLVLEYAARHPRRYGFVGGLSGALIGPLDTPRVAADLKHTPVLVACAERDAHIPLEYVEKTVATLAGFGADVTRQIFPGGAHTVFPEETAWLKKHASDWSRHA